VIYFIGDLCCWFNDFGVEGVVYFFGLYIYCFVFYVVIDDEECVCVFEYFE